MVDELDVKLIQELQKDGRESCVDLGRILGMAEATVRNRVKSLINKKLLKIAAVPNVSELGYTCMNVMALQVRMAELKMVADALAKKPNVCHLAFVTGRYDLIAIVLTRSPQELSSFIQDDISTIPAILRTETFVELEVIKGGWFGMDTAQLISNLEFPLLKKERRIK